MKSIKHWTPRYIVNRLNLWLYERRFPDRPWLNRIAISILMNYIKETDTGLELGSGRSTLWFSKRVLKLISVEHDHAWYKKVSNRLTEDKIINCLYHFCPPESGMISEDEEINSTYVRIIRELGDDSLDFALVDGIYRSACVVTVIDKLRPGGMLIIDNINWYLPNNSYAPSSRSLQDGPISEPWMRFQKAIETWRYLWTSDGVTDTAFFFKPCAKRD